MAYILLVEDNQQSADMTIRILESQGHTVKHILRGLESSVTARRQRPDAILMDFDLPDIDGRTMVMLLKKQLGGVNAPPIIALTARSGATEARLALQFGCAAFIAKPFAPEELIQTIERLVLPSLPK